MGHFKKEAQIITFLTAYPFVIAFIAALFLRGASRVAVVVYLLISFLLMVSLLYFIIRHKRVG